MKLPLTGDILPPSDDYVFKTLLTHPEAKPALMDLLSTITGTEITDVQIRNNELPSADADEKAERLDVNCTANNDSKQLNAEMQGTRLEEIGEGHDSFINKYVYYLTDTHSSQNSKGVEYRDLAQTYQIVFSMYTVFPDIEDYAVEINLRTTQGKLVTKQINMVIIELSKLKSVIKKPVVEMTSLEMWSIFLGYADDIKYRGLINEIIKRKEVLGVLAEVLTSISTNEDERAKYRSRRKAETDYMSNLLTAEERGKILGIEIGETRGEARKQKETARAMKLDDVPFETIMKYTNLSINEIQAL